MELDEFEKLYDTFKKEYINLSKKEIGISKDMNLLIIDIIIFIVAFIIGLTITVTQSGLLNKLSIIINNPLPNFVGTFNIVIFILACVLIIDEDINVRKLKVINNLTKKFCYYKNKYTYKYGYIFGNVKCETFYINVKNKQLNYFVKEMIELYNRDYNIIKFNYLIAYIWELNESSDFIALDNIISKNDVKDQKYLFKHLYGPNSDTFNDFLELWHAHKEGQKVKEKLDHERKQNEIRQLQLSL